MSDQPSLISPPKSIGLGRDPMECPLCGSEGNRVIYLGLPMKFCSDGSCGCLWGLWSFVAEYVPISDGECFAFAIYDGSYLRALWHWLQPSDVE